MIDIFALIPIAHAVDVQINPTIPALASAKDPVGLVMGFYNLALSLAGGLAFGVVVYAGFLYATSAGNSSKQSEAKDRVLQAFYGIILLLGAYILLNTINPALTNLTFPTLARLQKVTPDYFNPDNLDLMAMGCGGNGGMMVGSCPDPNTQYCAQVGMKEFTINNATSVRPVWECRPKSEKLTGDPCIDRNVSCSTGLRCQATTTNSNGYACVALQDNQKICSTEYPNGVCPTGQTCYNINAGVSATPYYQCKNNVACSNSAPYGNCSAGYGCTAITTGVVFKSTNYRCCKVGSTDPANCL